MAQTGLKEKKKQIPVVENAGLRWAASAGKGKAEARSESDPTGLSHFASHELIQAIGGLQTSSFIGAWTQPPQKAKTKFRPSILPENHSHPHVELCHVLSGQCSLSYRHHHFGLKQGDLVFLGPNVPHAESFRKKTMPYRLAWWIFYPEGVLLHVTDYSAKNGFRFVDRVILPASQEAREATHRLVRFASNPSIPQELAVKEALLVLAVFVMRKIMTGSKKEGVSAGRQCIEQAKEYIHKRIDQPLSLPEVANAVLLSPNYLTSLFHSETGLSLGNYIKRERVRKAKALLSGTKQSVKEIGLTLGFGDPYTFSRAFKRVEGVSPQRFRQLASA